MTLEQHGKFYFDNPKLWDAIRERTIGPEITFLDHVFSASKTGYIQNVLDIGCGTGQHSRRLTDLGYQCVGVDMNQHMVRHAQKNSPDLSFEIGDMRTFAIEHPMDAIIMMCTVFSYNQSNDEVLATLARARDNLRPGGILVIDNINPISLIENRSFVPTLVENEPYSTFNLRSIAHHRIIESAQVLEETREILDAKTGDVVRRDTTRFRLFFPQEMRFFLAQSGFENVQLHGSFAIPADFDLKHWRMISVATKT